VKSASGSEELEADLVFWGEGSFQVRAQAVFNRVTARQSENGGNAENCETELTDELAVPAGSVGAVSQFRSVFGPVGWISELFLVGGRECAVAVARLSSGLGLKARLKISGCFLE